MATLPGSISVTAGQGSVDGERIRFAGTATGVIYPLVDEDALLDQVFAVAPLHPAHHYRVHLWDQEVADRALRSAAVIGDEGPEHRSRAGSV